MTRAHDTCFAVSVFDLNGIPVFELLIYGITENEIYLTPNPYVSQALNRRGFLPGEFIVSPFAVRKIR